MSPLSLYISQLLLLLATSSWYLSWGGCLETFSRVFFISFLHRQVSLNTFCKHSTALKPMMAPVVCREKPQCLYLPPRVPPVPAPCLSLLPSIASLCLALCLKNVECLVPFPGSRLLKPSLPVSRDLQLTCFLPPPISSFIF